MSVETAGEGVETVVPSRERACEFMVASLSLSLGHSFLDRDALATLILSLDFTFSVSHR